MPDPLEQFLLEYVDTAGGIADAVESQVYDILLPDVGDPASSAWADKPLRVAFDPEALPEHPGAQLATFGSALLDQLLAQAQARGRSALAFLDDVHVTPHALEQRVRRDLILPPQLNLALEGVRALYVTTTLFWFEATFLSDEKEQALYPVAVERFYGRLVRYLEPLLTGERLSEMRRWHYPDAPELALEQAYLRARERVVRTVSAEAHSRLHELAARQAQQRARMTRYFADLRAELAERVEKAQARGEETESLQLRLGALQREEALRLDEAQRKAMLRVQVELSNVLHIKSPRLFLAAQLVFGESKRAPIPLKLTWDPLVEKTDAVDCPTCRHPTLELLLGPRGELRCANCNQNRPTKSLS